MNSTLQTITSNIISLINSKLSLSTTQAHYAIKVIFRAETREENRRVDFLLTTCLVGDNFRCHARFTMDRYFTIVDWYLAEKENFGPGPSDETYFIRGTISKGQIEELINDLALLAVEYGEPITSANDCGKFEVIPEGYVAVLSDGLDGYIVTENGDAISLAPNGF